MLKRPPTSALLGIVALVTSGVFAGSAQAAPVQQRLTSLNSSHPDGIVESPSGRASFILAQDVPAPEVDVPLNNLVGIVTSVDGSTLEIKLPDGQVQSYSADPSFASDTLTPGSFVEVSLNADDVIQDVKIPSVEKVVSGVISSIEGETVTLELADGTQESTIINPSTAERMNLEPGVPLTVTSYAGLTATKLCPTLMATCCQKPEPPIALPISPPVGGGDLQPKSNPLPQKW